MKQYLELLQTIKDKGVKKSSGRDGMPDTTSIFGYQMRSDLQQGFPLLTTQKMYIKGIIGELLWFLRGDTNIKYLVDNNINIWNKDAYRWYKVKAKEAGHRSFFSITEFLHSISTGYSLKDLIPDYKLGDLGDVYGKQWRDFDGSIDQIQDLIETLRKNPYGRRHIITAWNPVNLNNMALPPCHLLFPSTC